MSELKSGKKPSELEQQVLGVLWDRGELTARKVLESMPDEKPRAYTSILSVMQVMEKKGLLTRNSEGVTHLWSPAVQRDEVTQPLVKNLVRNVFGGSASAVVQQLLGGENVSLEELAVIKEMIKAHEEGKVK